MLLTVPFAARFADLTAFQKGVYLAALGLSAATTVTLIAPVAHHRVLFAQGRKPDLVRAANRLALAGLGLLSLTIGAVLLLVTDVVLDGTASIALAAAFALVTVGLWFVPALRRRAR